MPETEKPELEAVAWLLARGGTTRLPGVAEYEESMGRATMGLTPIAAAQDKLAQRDERIGELEAEIAAGDLERIAAQEECETLRAKLARWKPVIRASVAFRQHKGHEIQRGFAEIDRLHDALDTLSEQERSEILEGD